jgi:hypothetical protein
MQGRVGAPSTILNQSIKNCLRRGVRSPKSSGSMEEQEEVLTNLVQLLRGVALPLLGRIAGFQCRYVAPKRWHGGEVLFHSTQSGMISATCIVHGLCGRGASAKATTARVKADPQKTPASSRRSISILGSWWNSKCYHPMSTMGIYGNLWSPADYTGADVAKPSSSRCSDSRRSPLRSFIQFLAHILEQFRLRLGRILADLTRLRQSKRRNAMRRVKAPVVHPGDDLPTLRMLDVARLVIVTNERNVIARPLEL